MIAETSADSSTEIARTSTMAYVSRKVVMLP